MRGNTRTLLLAAVASCVTAAPAFAQVKQFDVPAQDAADAIGLLGRQANIQIVAARAFSKGKKTNAVRGVMNVEAALTTLLAGTGLTAQRSGPQTYVVVRTSGRSTTMVEQPVTVAMVKASASSVMDVQPEAQVAPGQAEANGNSPVAQEPQEAGADIVVTGIRASQRASLELKRSATVIVDAITATEVGKFPDANIADSLQRITGVAIQRNNGEGQFITVRGFGPQYNNVLVNGRTLATGTAGREFDFASLSSGLISRAEVYKTYQPQLQEGGIGATVNITTARPLDAQTGFHVTARGGGIYDLLSKQLTPDVGGVATYKNGDGTFGIEASLNYTQRKSFIDRAFSGGWFPIRPNSNSILIINGTPQSTGLTPAAYSFLNTGGTRDLYLPQTYETWRSTVDQQRLSSNATIQYRPADNVLVTLDGLYSRFTQNRIDTIYKSFFVPPYFSDITFDQNGTVSHFTRPGRNFFAANPLLAADPRSVGQQSDNVVNGDERRITTYQFGGNIKWEPLDELRFEADLSHSNARARSLGPGIVIGNFLNNPVNFDIAPGTLLPKVTLNETISPSQLTNHFTWLYGPRSNDAITEARLQAEWVTDWGPLQSVQFGGLYSERTKESQLFVTGGSNFCAYCGYSTPIDTSLIKNVSFNNWLSSSSGSNNAIVNFFTFDPAAVIAYQSLPATLNSRTASEKAALSTAAFLGSGGYTAVNQVGSSFVVGEQVFAGYLNTNWKGDFWTFNAGVRLSVTDTQSSGIAQPVIGIRPNPNDRTVLQFDYGPAAPITFRNSYFNLLPTANLKIDATSNLVGRLAVSKTLTRPTLSDLGPSNTFAGRDTEPLSSGGNPFLTPFTSWNYDASLEWYPAPDVSLSADVYRKDFSGFLSNQTVILPRDGFDAAGQPKTYQFRDTRPRNGNSGSVTGGEVAAQYAFSSGILSGLGVGANYTYVTSKQRVVTAGDCTQIEGLSTHSYNANAFYENHGIQARAAYNWRSKYLVACRGPQGQPQLADPYGQLDASVALSLNENFQVFVEGVNLTNSYTYQYSVFHNRILANESTGRRLLFGLRAKY